MVLLSLDIAMPKFDCSRRYSVLPALSLDGIIAVEVIDRPFTAAAFSKFIEGLLDQMNPWLQTNSVVIMDNASIHRSEELRLMIENRYVNRCCNQQ